MAINPNSKEARGFRFYSTNPQFVGQQPDLKVPGNPRIDQLRASPTETLLVPSTNIYYRAEIPRGLRPSSFENRQVTLPTQRVGDILGLAEKPSFKIPQLAVVNPSASERNWEAYVWLKPSVEVFTRLTPRHPSSYIERLRFGQIPWVSTSVIASSKEEAIYKIALDNSQVIDKLNIPTQPTGSLTDIELRNIADKYDPTTPYDTRFAGILLNFINLPRSNMLALGLLMPDERAEYLAIVDPKEQAEFLNSEIKEGFGELSARGIRERATAMMDMLARLTSPNNPTSNNDMEQLFNNMGVNEGVYGAAVLQKILYGVNLSSASLTTLTFMEPPHRLATLIQDDLAADVNLMTGADQLRARVGLLPPQKALPITSWLDLDQFRVA